MPNANVTGSNALLPLCAIIVNWNLPHDTIACIESLQASTPPVPGIIVVDNGSTDDSVRLFREHCGDTITILQNEQNLGFAGGVNVGIRHALLHGAQTLLLVNNDTIVAPDMVQHMLAAASRYPGAGLFAPAIYYYDAPQRIWRLGDKECCWLPIPIQISERDVRRAQGTPFQVDYVTGCGMLVHRTVFDHIGLFDTRYFMYFEDADFCRRTRQAGYSIWCVPAAKMWHKVSLSARKDKPINRYAVSWGRAQFYRTHTHGVFPQSIWVYLFFKALAITMHDIFSRNWRTIKPLWTGTLDGCLNRPSRYS